ncbi:MAG TPA: hypothetical protein VLH84_03325 [Patescibacteria group bacterium]|nr:hypothetical protein [Patescibacteria group bacterium]
MPGEEIPVGPPEQPAVGVVGDVGPAEVPRWEAPIRLTADLTEGEQAMVIAAVRRYRELLCQDPGGEVFVRRPRRRLPRRYGHGAVGAAVQVA